MTYPPPVAARGSLPVPLTGRPLPWTPCRVHGYGDPCPRCAEDDIGRRIKRIERIVTKILTLLSPNTSAVALTLTISGGIDMSTTFTVDEDGLATVQFVDDHADPTAGPLDGGATPSGDPIVPSINSDDTSIFPSGMVMVPDSTPGNFTLQLEPLAAGVANLSVAPLLNSDATPAVDAAGNAFTLPSPVEVTVTAGPAVALTMAVTGATGATPTEADPAAEPTTTTDTAEPVSEPVAPNVSTAQPGDDEVLKRLLPGSL